MSVRPDWGINDWKARCSELAFQVAELESAMNKIRKQYPELRDWVAGDAA